MTGRLVDPFKFTKFDRTNAELEAMLLFSIMVANKRADQTYAKFEILINMATLEAGGRAMRPFELIADLIEHRRLGIVLRKIRAGQYTRIGRAFRGVLTLNLRTCTVADLEAVPGIGPKTARMFLLHSRPNQRLAVLDTHLLAFLREKGVSAVPKSTPPAGATYRRLEEAYLAYCDDHGHDPAAFDLAVWSSRTRSRVEGAAIR